MNQNPVLGGYIVLHRSILASPLWENPRVFKVAITCLLKATYRDRQYGNVEIPRGSFLVSQREFASELRLDRRYLRDILKRLENAQFIAQSYAHNKTLISICDYELYQQTDKDTTPTYTPNNTPKVGVYNTQSGRIQHPHNITNKEITEKENFGFEVKNEQQKPVFNESEIPSLRSLWPFPDREKLKEHLMTTRGHTEHEAANIMEKVYSLEYTGKAS